MLTRFFQRLMIGGICIYRATLSRWLGGHCRFVPTCSAYGLEAIREWGPWRGGWMTLKRIGRCNPWGRGGVDLVPLREQGRDECRVPRE
jgi:putative membrane protein insertion efficiency factor